MESLHPDKATPEFLGLCIATGVLTALAIVCVTLRFIQRQRTVKLWWDDWTILAALIFVVGIFINTVLATIPSIGASGYHLNQYTIDGLNTWFKVSQPLLFASHILTVFPIAGLPCWRGPIQLFHRAGQDLRSIVLQADLRCGSSIFDIYAYHGVLHRGICHRIRVRPHLHDLSGGSAMECSPASYLDQHHGLLRYHGRYQHRH